MTVLSPDKKFYIPLPESTKKEGPKFYDVNEYGPLSTDTNLLALLKFLEVDVRLNMMTFEVEVFSTTTNEPVDQSPEQLRSWLRSHAIRHGLNKAIIDDHLTALAETHKYHPVAHWLDSEE